MRLFLSIYYGDCVDETEHVTFKIPTTCRTVQELAQSIANQVQLPTTPDLYLNEKYLLFPGELVQNILSPNDCIT